MKNSIRKFVTLTCFAVALSCAGFGQDLFDAKVTATIPFAFYAGDHHLPAGNYTFKVADSHRTTIRNEATGRTYWLLGKPADLVADSQTGLRFDTVGDVHVLHSLQSSGGSVNFFEKAPLLAQSNSVETAAGDGSK